MLTFLIQPPYNIEMGGKTFSETKATFVGNASGASLHICYICFEDI